MKKNITKLLQNGNLTPKERCQLFVQDVVAIERDGKGFLSDADKYALIEGWRPNDNYEVAEYNKYNNAWRYATYAEIDAQMTFLQTEIAYWKAESAATYYTLAHDREREGTGRMLGADEKQAALETVLQNSGLIREYAAYRYAFDLMDESLRSDLLKLYPDIETEQDYLKSELALYELLGEGGKPNDESKDKLAELIAKRAHNPYAAALAEKGNDSLQPWRFLGYYADIPLLDVAKKWTEYEGIDLPDKKDEIALEKWLVEKITDFAERRKTSVGALIKQAARQWLDEGLLQEHTPLFLSDGTETVNGERTALPHKEIFKQWLKAKTNAEKRIQAMIDKGELQTRTITDSLLGVEREHETILGKSLYGLKGDLGFVADYKKQAAAFLPVGHLFNIVRQNGLTELYAMLLAYQDIFTRLSKIFDTDLTEKVREYLAAIKDDVDLLNRLLQVVKDKYGCSAYLFNDCRYLMDVPQASFVIDLDAIKPDRERMNAYYKEFEKLLGDEF